MGRCEGEAEWFKTTEKNLSNEIEGTSKFVCYRQISLQQYRNK